MAKIGQPEKFTAQQMIDALKKTHGMITFAADLLHCSPNTVHRYINTYATVAEAMQEFTARDGDAVELALVDEAINKRNATVLMFLARTKFKDRGYTERMEHILFNVPLDMQQELKRELEAAGLDEQTVFRELIEAAKVRRALVGADRDSAE